MPQASYRESQVSPARFSTEFFDDLAGGTSAGNTTMATAVNGTGAAVNIDTNSLVDGNHWGLSLLITGTTATGRAAIYSGLTNGAFSGGRAIIEIVMRTPGALSDATDRYRLILGFGDIWNVGGSQPTDGVYFSYIDNEDSGRWIGRAANNGTISSTAAGAGPVVAAATWYRLRAEVNAAGTSASFEINGTNMGTVTTNIPVTNARAFGFGARILKTVGTTSRSHPVDYFYVRKDFTSAR